MANSIVRAQPQTASLSGAGQDGSLFSQTQHYEINDKLSSSYAF